jgi:tetratricopeptide (TPR) repeat protein
MAIFIVLLIPLAVLALVSLQLAFSGNLEGRLLLGWLLLIVVLVSAYELVARWMAAFPDPFTKIAAGVMGALLFGSQCPLLVALITHTILPDRSKGLRLLKAHSEAEKKVIEDDLPGAIAEYEMVIAEDPENIEARIRLADLLYQSGEHLKSAGAYEALLKRSDKIGADRRCFVLTRLSDLYANHLGDTAKARRFIETIIGEYPTTKYARYARARLSNL